MTKLCLENIEEEILNPFLKSLVSDLKMGIAKGIDPVRMTPLSAQLTQEYQDGPGHTDHTDYSAHQDSAPPHGDYCD